MFVLAEIFYIYVYLNSTFKKKFRAELVVMVEQASKALVSCTLVSFKRTSIRFEAPTKEYASNFLLTSFRT
jgi:hypothetical protein